MSDGRGPVEKTALMVVEWRAPDPECGVCGGSGDHPAEYRRPCECTEDTYREPTVDEVRAWLAEREVQRG